jgi:putative toxin-antitoxin system antitoxin component (TIGR02293 family)
MTDEAVRAALLLRVHTLAEDTLGSREAANAWLRRPLADLNGESPHDIAQTEDGARIVEAILAKIAAGSAFDGA